MGSLKAGGGLGVGRDLIAWAITLLGLVGLGVGYLIRTGVDPGEGFSPAVILIAWSPTLAALLVAGSLPGAGGVRALVRHVWIWRVGVGWYVLALGGPIALVLLTNVVHVSLGGAPPPHWFAVPSAAGFGAMLGPLVAGSLGEELGWRGFAQPRLQQRYSALSASVIVGVLWATWHQWPVFAPGGLAHVTSLDVISSYVRLISTAVLYGWLYNSTRGSLLLVMIAHAGHNIAIDLVPAPGAEAREVWALILAFLYLAAAIAVLWVTGSRTLTRSTTVQAR